MSTARHSIFRHDVVRQTWRAGWLFVVPLLLGGCAKLPDPLAKLTRELARYPEYSVVLEDMDVAGSFFKSYHHKYQVLIGEKSTGEEPAPAETGPAETPPAGVEGTAIEGDPGLTFRPQVRDWVEVDKSFFQKYEPMLGMVVLSKGADGSVDKANYPPGYQYVGNSRYGTWRTDSRGGSFWEFYGKYALFSHLLGSGRRPIYDSDYNSYRRSRSQRQPYYGPSNNYGTRGSYTRTARPNFYQRQAVRQNSQNERFAKKVRSRTSSSRSRSGGRGK